MGRDAGARPGWQRQRRGGAHGRRRRRRLFHRRCRCRCRCRCWCGNWRWCGRCGGGRWCGPLSLIFARPARHLPTGQHAQLGGGLRQSGSGQHHGIGWRRPVIRRPGRRDGSRLGRWRRRLDLGRWCRGDRCWCGGRRSGRRFRLGPGCGFRGAGRWRGFWPWWRGGPACRRAEHVRRANRARRLPMGQGDWHRWGDRYRWGDRRRGLHQRAGWDWRRRGRGRYRRLEGWEVRHLVGRRRIGHRHWRLQDRLRDATRLN